MDLLERRGYAAGIPRLAEVCLGGRLSEREVMEAVEADPDLDLVDGLVLRRDGPICVARVLERRRRHSSEAAAYAAAATRFSAALVTVAPFVRSVSIAGSLASGGFVESDDVDLNLVVDDGHRYQAYFVLNLLGLAHALAHRGKPVDVHTRRPVAPRLMTANLILERSQCFPLARQDEDMAFELLISRPVHGAAFVNQVVAANPRLLDHLPQLAERTRQAAPDVRPRVPAWLYPDILEAPARMAGHAAWRYMQWTRRRDPAALERVAFVRDTMRPYALFDDPA